MITLMFINRISDFNLSKVIFKKLEFENLKNFENFIFYELITKKTELLRTIDLFHYFIIIILNLLKNQEIKFKLENLSISYNGKKHDFLKIILSIFLNNIHEQFLLLVNTMLNIIITD
jgi:hypothetical protein